MTFQWSCFCVPCYRAKKSITVNNNQCETVELVDEINCTSTFNQQYLECINNPTILDLFELIYHSIFNSNAGDVRIEYNDEFGYPMSGFIDAIETATDDEIWWTIDTFTVTIN